MHKTIAPKENIPGHIKIEGFVDINAIMMDISTVLSQKISNIPPNLVIPFNLAMVPSRASIKKEIPIIIAEIMINIKLSSLKIPLKKIRKAVCKPNIKPIIVRRLAEKCL